MDIVNQFTLMPRQYFYIQLAPLCFKFPIDNLLWTNVGHQFISYQTIVRSNHLFSHICKHLYDNRIYMVRMIMRKEHNVALGNNSLHRFIRNQRRRFLHRSPTVQVKSDSDTFCLYDKPVIIEFIHFHTLFQRFLHVFQKSAQTRFHKPRKRFTTIQTRIMEYTIQ